MLGTVNTPLLFTLPVIVSVNGLHCFLLILHAWWLLLPDLVELHLEEALNHLQHGNLLGLWAVFCLAPKLIRK